MITQYVKKMRVIWIQMESSIF